MKKFFLLIILFGSLFCSSQNYLRNNIDLISLIVPNDDTLENPNQNRYSGCWGWYQASKNKEYAISGTSNGTYFIDVSVPASPSVCAFVPGKKNSTWREMKTYQNYCYITCDDAQPNKFTIVDMQYLPDSVHIVHYGNKYFERGHTIWIDQDKMYIGATTYSSGSSAMTVWSLANPEDPVLLRRVEQDIPPPVFSYVHDMYVRNDTIYASTGWQGLHILRLDSNNIFQHLGSYSGYPSAGYNHSSFLTQNGKHLVFCDEVPSSIPIHLVDVQNFGNIQPVKTFNPDSATTPHNPYIIGNKWAIVSCYQDGLHIYDISNPTQISHAGFFDTYPQGGANAGDYRGETYKGNWGAYPFLPSGIIVANDMQNGVFILDASDAYNTNIINPVGLPSVASVPANLIVYPNPANTALAIHLKSNGKTRVRIFDMLGKEVYSKNHIGAIAEAIDVSALENGNYVLSVTNDFQAQHKKIIIHH